MSVCVWCANEALESENGGWWEDRAAMSCQPDISCANARVIVFVSLALRDLCALTTTVIIFLLPAEGGRGGA